MTDITLPAVTKKTLVTLLLDRTGSMQCVARQTVDAVNSYIGELKSAGAPIYLTLVQFDATQDGMQLEKLYEATPINEVKALDYGDFQPRGTTPLYDATGTIIEAIDTALGGREANVIVAITSDGQSNADHRFNAGQVREMIAGRIARGWQFAFLGTGGIDAYEQSRSMGIAASNTVNYGPSAGATRAAFASLGANTAMFASGMRATMAYTAEQKAAAGDMGEAAPQAGVYGPAMVRQATQHAGGMGVGAAGKSFSLGGGWHNGDTVVAGETKPTGGKFEVKLDGAMSEPA